MKKHQKSQAGQMNDIIYDQYHRTENNLQWRKPAKSQYLSPKHTLTHIMLTQSNIKDGLNAYGNKGHKAILKEVKQLHTQQAPMPQSRHIMSYNERKTALRYLMFLNEKRDGSIKARGCAYCRPQRIYTNKEDASLPTVSIEAMLLSCA